MKNKKFQKKWIAATAMVVGAGHLLINPEPMYAIFGLGDVVFDPTSYARFGEIWGQDISNGAKLAQTYNQTVKLVANGLQLYQIAHAMEQRVQNKRVWMEAAFAAGNEVTEQHYNETVNMNAVMNGDVLHAGQAWHQSTLNAGNGGYLGSSTATNSRRMSEYATIQLLDQTSQRCATILANYKSTQDLNLDAESKLDSDVFDQSDAKNASVALLNVLSGGQIHIRNQNKANGNLQACMAEQHMLEGKIQRDRIADEQRWYADISNEQANAPALLDPDTTATWAGSYLVP